MGDMGDMYRDWNKAKKEKRQANQESSTAILEKSGVKFESKNWGNHLVVSGRKGLIDFWPSTGKFIPRYEGGWPGRGIRKLLSLCELTKQPVERDRS